MIATRPSARASRLAGGLLAAALTAVLGASLAAPVTAAPVTRTAPVAPILAIRALQATVEPGGTGVITGSLRSPGLSLKGRTVDLEARPKGERGFTPIGTATANDKGQIRLAIAPAVTTRYRWHYAGDIDAKSRVSGVVKVRVRTVDGPGRRRATTLSAAAQRGVVNAGEKDIVQGQLRWGERRLGRRPVVLLARPVGKRSWQFRTSHRTGRLGRVAFRVRPAFGTEYRLAFPGTRAFRPATSGVVTVLVRPTLTITVDPARVAPGESARITGVVRHAESAVAGATVVLQARAAVKGSRWAVVDRTSSAADGTIEFVARPEETTRYRLRVRPAGGLPRGASRVVAVQVTE